MTRFIYALKEIRACIEAEALTDVQRRLDLLSQRPKGHISRAWAHMNSHPLATALDQDIRRLL